MIHTNMCINTVALTNYKTKKSNLLLLFRKNIYIFIYITWILRSKLMDLKGGGVFSYNLFTKIVNQFKCRYSV